MLFEPMHIKGMTLKNKMVMPPMCNYMVTKEDGKPTEYHMQHYLSRAISGVGLIIQEATAITPNGRISKYDLGLWNEEQTLALKPLVEAVQKTGSKMMVQINHAGRKNETSDGKLWAPSALQFSSKYQVPAEMTLAEIKEAKQAFITSIKRALSIGYDGVELHAAHGYLMSSFLSPVSNQRKDEYGGSVENRVRFLKEILEEIHTFYPKDKLLFVRISAEDYVPNGNHVQDLIDLMMPIKHLMDAIHVSSGGVSVDQKIIDYPMYQLEFARTIKQALQIPTIAVGKINTVQQAEYILHSQAADMVAFGRELLRNPFFAAQNHPELIKDYPSYSRGF